VHVLLPSPLAPYGVRVPENPCEQVRAIQASLRFLSLPTDRITIPLLASVYRAALGKADFSVFLTGPSGAFKTALAALCQHHFGAVLDASRLPANFASTPNALEGLAFTAKDTLLVVDDFAPTGTAGDHALRSVAERLFRAAGTSGAGCVRAPQPPRAILATGEEVPRGQSLRARLLILELAPADVDRMQLASASRWRRRAMGLCDGRLPEVGLQGSTK
jgi:hypothetical protein